MNESGTRVWVTLLFALLLSAAGLSSACNSVTRSGSGAGDGAAQDVLSEEDVAAESSPGSSAPELAADGRPVGWGAETHSNDVAADYSVVFPEGKVNRLDITIAPEDWQAMQDNMTELYGEPGGPGTSHPP